MDHSPTPPTQASFSDAYSPVEIAERVKTLGVKKARTDLLTLLTLAVLAGAFIALGGVFYSVVISGSELGFGPTRLLGGIAFSLGLILVVCAGAELFTGNNLLVMAWSSGLIGSGEVMRNWVVVYLGNIVGALGTVALCYLGEVHTLGGAEGLEPLLIRIGDAKAALSPMRAFVLGILCNALVCLAVWLTLGCRSVTDKVLAILLPIAAFVACGFEHCVANWFFLPYAALLGDAEQGLSIAGAGSNLLFVTLGNVVGGSVFVAGIYWAAYLRPKS